MMAPRPREIVRREGESDLEFMRRGAVEFGNEAWALVYLADVLLLTLLPKAPAEDQVE